MIRIVEYGKCKEEAISECFHSEDVGLILRIPLSRRCAKDKLIWNEDTFGQFKMRSAYFVARKLLGREELLVKCRSPIWKLVQSAKVLLKIKYFMGRLLWAILPTRDNLIKQGLQSENICCIYMWYAF